MCGHGVQKLIGRSVQPAESIKLLTGALSRRSRRLTEFLHGV
jgi:hypothetical protein